MNFKNHRKQVSLAMTATARNNHGLPVKSLKNNNIVMKSCYETDTYSTISVRVNFMKLFLKTNHPDFYNFTFTNVILE